MPEPLNFIKFWNECINEAHESKNWTCKIDIAEFEAKKAHAIIRKLIQMPQLQKAEFGCANIEYFKSNHYES